MTNLYINNEHCLDVRHLKQYFQDLEEDSDIYLDLLDCARYGDLVNWLNEHNESHLATEVLYIDKTLGDTDYMNKLAEIVVASDNYVPGFQKPPFEQCVNLTISNKVVEDDTFSVELSFKIVLAVNENYEIKLKTGWGTKGFTLKPVDYEELKTYKERFTFHKGVGKNLEKLSILVDDLPYGFDSQDDSKVGAPVIIEKYIQDDLTLLVNWICDEFKKEKAIDWHKDEKMMNIVHDNIRKALNRYKASLFNQVDIEIPYVANYDSNGNPIHTTNFRRTLSRNLLHSLRYSDLDIVEDKSWGWELVGILDRCLYLKKHNGKYGLVDFGGIIIAQCEYDEIMLLNSGSIRLQKNGKYGLMNVDKTINIPCIYDELLDFKDGFAKVKIDGEWVKINESGVRL